MRKQMHYCIKVLYNAVYATSSAGLAYVKICE